MKEEDAIPVDTSALFITSFFVIVLLAGIGYFLTFYDSQNLALPTICAATVMLLIWYFMTRAADSWAKTNNTSSFGARFLRLFWVLLMACISSFGVLVNFAVLTSGVQVVDGVTKTALTDFNNLYSAGQTNYLPQDYIKNKATIDEYSSDLNTEIDGNRLAGSDYCGIGGSAETTFAKIRSTTPLTSFNYSSGDDQYHKCGSAEVQQVLNKDYPQQLENQFARYAETTWKINERQQYLNKLQIDYSTEQRLLQPLDAELSALATFAQNPSLFVTSVQELTVASDLYKEDFSYLSQYAPTATAGLPPQIDVTPATQLGWYAVRHLNNPLNDLLRLLIFISALSLDVFTIIAGAQVLRYYGAVFVRRLPGGLTYVGDTNVQYLLTKPNNRGR